MRICFYGGPCCGKSTVAMRITSEFKVKGHSIEYTGEYIKKWAYENRKPKSFDQTYIFGHQLHLEDLVMQSDIKNLVTDSPLLMNACYAKRYDYPLWKTHVELCSVFEQEYPALNIFLDRTGVDYQESGRYENYKQAIWMDGQIREFMDNYLESYLIFSTIEIDEILSAVEEKLEC